MDKETTTIKPTRNYCLAFFEAIACILIVFIHARFPGTFGRIVESLGRFGVPLFFAVSGFFLIKESSTVEEVRAKLKKRIIKILIIYLCCALVQDTFSLIGASQNGSVKEWALEIFSWQNILFYVFCNRPFVSVPLWFLLAMLNSYAIIYIFARHFINKKLLPVVIASFAFVFIVFRTIAIHYHLNINGHYLNSDDFYHSWFANGLIFICLGILIRRYSKYLALTPLWVTLLVLFISAVAMVGERMLYYHIFGDVISYYLFNIVFVITAFTLSIQKPLLFSKLIIMKIPDDWTMFVYVLHPGIMYAVEYVLRSNMDPIAFGWTYPLIVLSITLILAIPLAFLLKLVKDKRKLKTA